MQASCQSPPAGEEEGLRALEMKNWTKECKKNGVLTTTAEKSTLCIKVAKRKKKKKGFSLIGKK